MATDVVTALEHRYVLANGLLMHAYASAGPADLRSTTCPVVLVHGLIVTGQYLLPTARILAHTHPVYVPELPGYGRSARVKPLLSVAQFADALVAWLDAMDLPRVTLLGNSFGCQIAAEAAMRFPERFDRLILTGPTVDPDHRSVFDLAWRLTADVPRERLSIVPLVVGNVFNIGWMRSFRALPRMARDRIEERLPHIITPTLIVTGVHDTLAPRAWVEQMVQMIPNARAIIIHRSPHALPYSAPQQLVRVMQPFLEADMDDLHQDHRVSYQE